jgi:hypothetical protein
VKSWVNKKRVEREKRRKKRRGGQVTHLIQFSSKADIRAKSYFGWYPIRYAYRTFFNKFSYNK